MAYTSCVGCRYSIHVASAPGPLPRRSSAPKLSRMKMNGPKVFWLRTSQGVMHAKKMADASATPANDRLPRFARRIHAHRPAAGRNDNREVLLSAVMPHSSPNSSHGSQPSRSCKVRASKKVEASSSAARLVSQIERVHQNRTFGSRAHAQAEPTATFSEKIRLAIRKIGTHVSAEKMLLIVSSMNADAFE